MNEQLGTVISALITDENDKNYFVQKDGITYQLGKNETERKIGEMVSGFIYTNMNDKTIMTTDLPKVRQARYGWGTITQVRKDLGVFVDIGLPDKDIVVSLDDLPSETRLWPKKEEKIMIKLSVDKKDRIWGKLAEDHVFTEISRKLPPQQSDEWRNREVVGTVYHSKIVGSYIITTDYYLAFLHEDERDQEPRLGQEITGRVIGVGQNGNLNLSVKPRAFEAISDDAEMIIALLDRQPTHFLPYHDKSSPDEIKEFFFISKARFKRALGNLMKNQKITQTDEGIYLKDNQAE